MAQIKAFRAMYLAQGRVEARYIPGFGGEIDKVEINIYNAGIGMTLTKGEFDEIVKEVYSAANR